MEVEIVVNTKKQVSHSLIDKQKKKETKKNTANNLNRQNTLVHKTGDIIVSGTQRGAKKEKGSYFWLPE